jgi:hypothetical protein
MAAAELIANRVLVCVFFRFFWQKKHFTATATNLKSQQIYFRLRTQAIPTLT